LACSKTSCATTEAVLSPLFHPALHNTAPNLFVTLPLLQKDKRQLSDNISLELHLMLF